MCDGVDTWRRLDADFASIIGRMEVVAADTGRTVPTASAQTGRGRAAHNAGEGGGVVIELKRGSRSAQGEWAWRLPLDDDHRVRGYPDSRKLVAPARLQALRPKW